MRKRIKLIFACLAALLGAGLILSWALQTHQRVLLHRATRSGAYDFLVADRGSLIFARQRVTAPAADQGDASIFGQFKMTINRSGASGGQRTFSGNHITINADQITIFADPITPNLKHGFLWLNVNSGGLPPPGGSIQLFCRAAGAPMWVLGVPLLAPLPILLIRRARKSRRQRLGLCAACGYDLRASPDRCPECGRSGHAAVSA